MKHQKVYTSRILKSSVNPAPCVARRYWKQLIILFISALPFSGVHAQEADDILFWTSATKLTFEDFKRKIPEDWAEGNTLSSHKHGSIVKAIDVRLIPKKGATALLIRAGMKRNLSYIKVYGDTISLKHEQGHFDICEIYARMLRRDIKKSKSLLEAKAIYEKILADEEVEHDRYDKENTFQAGGITGEWARYILRRLNELGQYQTSVVTLPFDK